MTKRPFANVKLVLFMYQPSSSIKRALHSSVRLSSDVTLPLDPIENIPAADPRRVVRAQKFADLKYCLSRKASPSRVWSHYSDLLNYLGYEDLPLEIHQDVLRKCTPSSAELRIVAAKRLLAGNRPRIPHIHEQRFKTVMLKIRAAGWQPTLEDYHFVLEQFAAVGHHTGMEHVYKEMTHFGLQPRTTTYGLCLQTIAHRLALPYAKLRRPRLLVETRKMCGNLMKHMHAHGIPFTSVNLDLAMRILKETSDEEGFSLLLKIGYGIDLVFPDRPPLGYLDNKEVRPELRNLTRKLPSPQPFSTAALNTTIDMLGRFGNVSKVVQAFEVLTQPLPPQASQHFSSSFDDEDDDYGVSVNPPSTQKYQFPHAEPNTTTYNMLLRHLSRAGHAVFARHYLLQAMELDRLTDRTLRGELITKPLGEVLAPHFAINKGTLLSVFGQANRDKNLQLMRWVWSKFPKIIRRKKNDLVWYTDFHARIQRSLQVGQDENVTRGSSAISAGPATSPLSEPPITMPNSSASSSSPTKLPQTIQYSPVFDVDLDAPDVPSPPVKYFDITLHLEILRRDIEQIEAFGEHVRDIFGRTTQRVKERLGRRVWEGKDIYLLTDKDQRRRISRSYWGDIVHFKPRQVPSLVSSALSSRGGGAPYVRPGWLASHRGVATFRFSEGR